MKAALIRYRCILALLGTMLAGCQSSLAPQQSHDISYLITGNDSNSRGTIHIVSADEMQVEWDAWLDWHEGGQSVRSVFHSIIKLDNSGAISEASITRHPDETLHITVLADHLHCELSLGNQPARSFDIALNGAVLFIPPLPFPSKAQNIVCFDPFSWDYILVRTSPVGVDSIGLFAGEKKVGTIETSGGMIDAWELPLTAMAQGRRGGFDAESVPAAAVIHPTLNAQDLAHLSTLTLNFDLTLPPQQAWRWTSAGDFIYATNTCQGEWVFSNKGMPAKPGGKSVSSDEADWSVNPAQLATIQAMSANNPQSAAIPSSPLSALVRGIGDDASRAWLASTLAQKQGWRARIAGGIVLRPGQRLDAGNNAVGGSPALWRDRDSGYRCRRRIPSAAMDRNRAVGWYKQ